MIQCDTNQGNVCLGVISKDGTSPDGDTRQGAVYQDETVQSDTLGGIQVRSIEV